MKRLLCKLGLHSWTAWHLVHSTVAHAVYGPPGRAIVVRDGKSLYMYTRRCYHCGREEFREEVGK